MVSLSDRELQLLMDLARPIPVGCRDLFLEAVTEEPRAYPPERIGEGLVHQVTRRVQRDFIDPPRTETLARSCRAHGDL